MKKTILLLVSMSIFYACRENVETNPNCDSNSILTLDQHLAGKWNTIGSVNLSIGMKSIIDFNENGTVQTQIDFIDVKYADRGILHEAYRWRMNKYNSNSIGIIASDRGSSDFGHEFITNSITCDRIDLGSSDNRLILYKDNYKIAGICGSDTTNGNAENWLIGKWNYNIVQNPGYTEKLIRTPRGIVEFKNDFTISDSNPFGIFDAFSNVIINRVNTIPKLIWHGDNFIKSTFFIFGNQNNNNGYYTDAEYSRCILSSTSCDKIIFETDYGHKITLERLK
jgi:hypothetical protein